MKKIIVTLLALTLFSSAYAADAPTAQSLYLQAGKEERSGSAAKARELYEHIIDKFPESEFAVKANDRLLAIAPQKSAPAATAATTPASATFPGAELLAPEPPKPLPADPAIRAAVEAARLKDSAQITYREEMDRQKRVYEARMGRKGQRLKQAETEMEWRQAAERKVVEVNGMTLEEIVSKAEARCKELGVKGECSEDNLTRKTQQ